MACLVGVCWGLGLEARGAAPLRAVPFNDVTIEDTFWSPRRTTNRLVSIPVNLDNLEKAGNLENLRLAAKGAREGFQGPVFMDSDVYKALEAASYSLATEPDPVLGARLDGIIDVLAAAQQPDGYLNSYYTVKEPGRRWTNLRDNHELYCAGHLLEAAVAHYRATGKTNFLGVARRLADHIDTVFGPPPKRLGYPGHPEIELALVKLWRATGERRYFELARFFVENRGRGFFATEHRTPPERYDGRYWQDDMPIAEHRSIKGHAVRAAYLMSGVTDVVSETGDARLRSMLGRVWRNTVERNQYITGGIGPSSHNEGFTEDYDLPNASAYQETCATIALAQWAHRLGLLHAEARYADVVERALYNGMLAGVSQDGCRFFYVNPLESRGTHHRSAWFSCACCPPNVARTLASLGEYVYAQDAAGAVVVNLYVQGSARVNFPGGRRGRIQVDTAYPWSGEVRIRLAAEGGPVRAELRARIPGWCHPSAVQARLNGEPVAVTPALRDGYLVLTRDWAAGDELRLNLDMPVERVEANPNVTANRGAVALQRGPLVYCLEQVDVADPLERLYLPLDAPVRLDESIDLRDRGQDAPVRLVAMARVAPEVPWGRRLYRAMPPSKEVRVTAIPYHAWDNRRAGPMRVWLPVAPPVAPVGGLEMQAQVTSSFASGYASLVAARDGRDPVGSRKHPGQLCHWWPHKGGGEWLQYTWNSPVRIGGAEVYWFDDTGTGECRLPEGWEIQYQEGEAWKPVEAVKAYETVLDRWCSVTFSPVVTRALRLVVRQPAGFATGLHEWRVLEAESDEP